MSGFVASQEKRISSAQRRAIIALISGRSNSEAAERAGVSSRTISRWMQLPAFRSELQAAEASILQCSLRRLARLTQEAVGVLGEVMLNGGVKPAARIAAANMVLSRFVDLHGEVELSARLDRLEEEIHELGNKQD